VQELLNSLSSDNLVVLCLIMGVISLALAVAISIEIINSNKKYKKLLKEKENNNNKEPIKLNIKEDSNIKYVDEEDKELEKTKAKIELENLREKLQKEELEKQKKLGEAIETNKSSKTEEPKKEEVQEIVQEEKKETLEFKEEPKPEKITKTLDLDEALKKVRAVNDEKIEELEKTKELNIPDIETLNNLANDEDDAIISYEELKKSQTFGYTDEEMENYVDEENAIISIEELEKLYLESQKIDVEVEQEKEVLFEMKKVEDLPKIADSNDFKQSPMISPVYGRTKTEQELVLEQTANLEKLNEEIKKTNEFLKTLKDLKKNLE
jgi:hypothetical protein